MRITESKLNQIIANSIRRVLKENEEFESAAPNELAEYMVSLNNSAAASLVSRFNYQQKSEAFDYAREELGDEKYIECLESIILCMGPAN